MNLPFSDIIFKENEGIMALKCLAIKTNPWFYQYDCEVCLNGELFLEDYGNFFDKLHDDSYIFKYKTYLNKLNKINKFKIFFKKTYNFSYTNHILVYPVRDDENDEFFLDIELAR